MAKRITRRRLGFIVVGISVLMILGTKYIPILYLSKVTETENFTFYWTESAANFLSCLPQAAETSYQRISADLQNKVDRKITIKIYNNSWIYNLSNGNPLPWPNLRATGNATAKTNEIDMLLPPLTDPTYQEKKLLPIICQLGVGHEIAHLVVSDINPQFQRGWWHEGIAMYEDYSLIKDQEEFNDTFEKMKSDIKPIVHEDILPSFQNLSTKNFQTFVSLKGYELSYTFIDFVVYTYGLEKLSIMAQHPNDYNKVFGSSENAVWESWKEYLVKNYSN